MATDTAPASAAAETPPPAPATEAPEVDFDDPASVQAAIARAEGGDMAHPKPSVRSRRAPKLHDEEIRRALTEPAEEAEEVPEEPEGEGGETPTPEAPAQAAAVTESTRRLLQHYHLPPPRDGETEDQAFGRIRQHDSARWGKHDRERRQLETKLSEQGRQLAALTALEPVLRAWAEDQAARNREAQIAATPDPETDTDAYNRVQLERLHQRMDERERAEEEQRRRDAQAAAEEERMTTLLDVDEQNVAELERALTENEEVRRAHRFVYGVIYRDAQRTFTDATAEELAEFANNATLLNMRQLRTRGLSPIQALLDTMADVQALYGPVPTAAAPNGNGAAHPAPKPSAGSPTEQRIRKEAAAAAARRPVSSATRAGGPSGVALDISKITDPDELFALLKSGKITEDMIQAQLGQPART